METKPARRWWRLSRRFRPRPVTPTTTPAASATSLGLPRRSSNLLHPLRACVWQILPGDVADSIRRHRSHVRLVQKNSSNTSRPSICTRQQSISGTAAATMNSTGSGAACRGKKGGSGKAGHQGYDGSTTSTGDNSDE